MRKSATSPRLQHAQYAKRQWMRNANEFEAAYGTNAQCLKGDRFKAWANARIVKLDTNAQRSQSHDGQRAKASSRRRAMPKTARRCLKAKRCCKARGKPQRKRVITAQDRGAQSQQLAKRGGIMNEESNQDLMTVGELASRVGVTVRTIQYYDQRGLLPPTCKGEQNLRLYSPADEERLNRIITLKYLGFSLSQIQEGEGGDPDAELTSALARREAELERESTRILRDMNTLQGLRAHLANRDQANWSELAATVGVAQDREDMLWSAITGEALEECPIPELSREEVICWHQLMGDTIEAMHDGVLVTDDRAKALAIRFSSLGGMPHALAGLKRLACQRSSGPKQYGRDFYAGIQRRTLSFLQDALDCSHANANTQA